MTAMFPAGAALVIGATGGMGAAVARELASCGSAVALGYRSRRDGAEALARELSALGVAASVHQLDATDPATLGIARDAAVAAHGRLHTLVWAAGPLVEQLLIAEMTPQHWQRAIAVEVGGFFAAVQAMLPHFRERGGGSFVHLGSAGALRWPDRDGLSVAPKAANESLVRGIAREEGRHGIRANSVLVGVIDAGMFHELLAAGAFDAAWEAETKRALAIKRWGRPEEIGQAAAFLASDRASYITGQQIAVAGGYGI
jgi:NAD(P)-dependent dehydrogenase (short-subunit alcohol dehydrogenase family)